MPLANGNFIPEIWSKKLNARFYSSTVCMAIANRNWEGEIKEAGSKVIIRDRPEVEIQDYVAHQTLTYGALSVGKQELLIDRGKMFTFKVDDIEKVQSDVKLINEASDDAAQKMKIHIDRDVLGNIYTGVHADNVIDGTAGIDKTNVLDAIVDAGTLLDESDTPEVGRWLVIPPWMAGMIKKSDLKDASVSGDGTSIMRNGRLGMIDRFTLYSSNNLTTIDGTGKLRGEVGFDPNTALTKIIGGTRDFFTFASQFTKTETVRLESQFGDGVRGLNLYGFKVVLPQAGVLVNAKKG